MVLILSGHIETLAYSYKRRYALRDNNENQKLCSKQTSKKYKGYQ